MSILSDIDNYTNTNRQRVKSLVDKVNGFSEACESITSDKGMTSFTLQGSFQRTSKERQAFMLKTEEFRRRLRNGEAIESILPEALAVVREATRRTLNMFPYDTQIEAAIAMIGNTFKGTNEQGEKEILHEHVIAEMKTGEGKTLVQILVAYLNALVATKDENPENWSNVHVMTSNDALAKRDATNNKKVFYLLGLSCDFVPSRRSVKGASLQDRVIYKHRKKQAYTSDIVYATASTIAFDYLDDNTVVNASDRNITRKLGFAVVDEADDILIDQATSPLKISGTPVGLDSNYETYLEKRQKDNRMYYKWATEFLYGKEGVRSEGLTYTVFDQEYANRKETFKTNYAYIMDTGEIIFNKSGRVLNEIGEGVADEAEYNARYLALLDCIKARHAFLSDREYKVQVDGDKAQIILIDQNVGRKKYQSKYVDGMQEAIEAKEEYLEQDSPNARKRYHIEFSEEKSVRATCTYPDFLSVYPLGVSGMTGTSDDEEFRELYGMETYRVDTRKKNIRVDEEDLLFATKKEKYDAIIREVIDCYRVGRPVLIGTSSVEESLIISSLLKDNGITHNLLNADNEEIENQIIETAGLFGSITVATNMAGRGTDIKLGPGVRELGGLYVIGTSRNKSSRIDLQLRGRAARQGDPGSTRYYSSLEDDLVKEHFRGDILKALIESRDTGKPIKSKRCIKAAKRCQELKESKDKESRIVTEKFNKSFIRHRKIIYKERNEVLDSNSFEFMNMIKTIMSKYVNHLVDTYTEEEISSFISHIVDVRSCYDKNKNKFKDNLLNSMWTNFRSMFPTRSNQEIVEYVKNIKKKFLNVMDVYWIEHIDVLRGLRLSFSLSQTEDPFKAHEYKANDIFFQELIPAMYNEMLTYAFNPSMRFGEYQITYPQRIIEEREMQL